MGCDPQLGSKPVLHSPLDVPGLRGRASTSAEGRIREHCGRDERSYRPASPSMRNRATQR